MNLIVTTLATALLRAVGSRDVADETREADYTDAGPAPGVPLGEAEELGRAA